MLLLLFNIALSDVNDICIVCICGDNRIKSNQIKIKSNTRLSSTLTNVPSLSSSFSPIQARLVPNSVIQSEEDKEREYLKKNNG